jgi:hypothetical protein
MSDDFWVDQLRKHVAARRERTGQKFETCERMKPVFAALDEAGWNDWPPSDAIKDRAEPRKDKP